MTDIFVDANSLFSRCYHASKSSARPSELRDEDDQVPGSTELGIKMMLNLLDPHGGRIGKRVDRMLFCWDGKPKRDKQRPPRPDDYPHNMDQFVQAMKDLFGAAHVTSPEHEADDAVATAVYAADEDTVIYVVSGDKDLQQLASENVRYYSLNESAVLSRKFILDRWNVLRPSQICIALAILGDSGDNVPGIHGWGPKRVKELFKKVTKEMDLDEALQAIVSQIPESLLPVFYESLDLTVLDPDVPGVPPPLEVSFASVELVKALGFPMLTGRYAQVKRAYEISEASVMRAIDEA